MNQAKTEDMNPQDWIVIQSIAWIVGKYDKRDGIQIQHHDLMNVVPRFE